MSLFFIQPLDKASFSDTGLKLNPEHFLYLFMQNDRVEPDA